MRGRVSVDFLLSVLFGDFDDERFAGVCQPVAVHLPDRFFGFLTAIEADESRAAKLSGPLVAQQLKVDDFAEARKEVANGRLVALRGGDIGHVLKDIGGNYMK